MLIFLIKFKNYLNVFKHFFIKAYSSMVERTAHNGLVVGSNPTKLKKRWTK